ncbi:MAG TPA: ABC transporter permease [Vicinamibacterales bacterium]|nr:ABC transporter permease [Vicinamibacterales bacterium]
MVTTDLRYALRSIARQKTATALVLLMLSLGIAANVAVFSLVNGLFLRPFAFPEQDRLVFINETAPKWNLEIVGINYPDFHTWREGVKLFEGIAIWDGQAFNLSTSTGAERIRGAVVTHDLAKVLGIRPILGRDFVPEEDKPKGPPVVLITEGVWRERFGGRPDVLGQTLKLDGVSRTIVGVLPPEADFPANAQVWVPLQGDPNEEGQNYSYNGVGRMKAGVTVEAAGKDLLRAHEPVWKRQDQSRIVSPFARSLRAEFVRDFTSAAQALTAAVGLLLLVACANVASLMLARAFARRREMGIRLALGATRSRIVRQLFAENMILAVAGAAIGLALGQWAIQLLLANVPDELPHFASFGMDARVIVFAVVASMVTVVLFGWAPALHASRGDLRSTVQATTAGTTGSPKGKRTLWVLVAGEFALAALLLVCAGLLMRAFDRVRHVDPGFRVDGVLTFAVSLPEASYPKEHDRLAFWERVSERMKAIPGVDSAGLITCLPLGCHWGNFFRIEGVDRKPGESVPVTLMRYASADYFKTMGIRLKSGRFFDDRDGREPQPVDLGYRVPRVAIVNETFAKTFWPTVADPVGRRFKFNDDKAPWMTVVGLVRDIKHYGLERPMRPGVYFPLPADPRQTLAVALHTSGDAAALAGSARAAMRELDPDLPLFQVRTMEEALQRSLTVRAAYSWMLGVFALLALILALGGTYGVASYLVTQRTREIGIRVALGARTIDVVRTVVGRGVGVVVVGIAVGVLASVGATRLLADLLFGSGSRDAVIFAGVASLLLATALLANWLPTRRAARIDPMRSLRTE